MTEVREIVARAIHSEIEVGIWEDFVDEAGGILSALDAAGYVVVRKEPPSVAELRRQYEFCDGCQSEVRCLAEGCLERVPPTEEELCDNVWFESEPRLYGTPNAGIGKVKP